PRETKPPKIVDSPPPEPVSKPQVVPTTPLAPRKLAQKIALPKEPKNETTSSSRSTPAVEEITQATPALEIPGVESLTSRRAEMSSVPETETIPPSDTVVPLEPLELKEAVPRVETTAEITANSPQKRERAPRKTARPKKEIASVNGKDLKDEQVLSSEADPPLCSLTGGTNGKLNPAGSYIPGPTIPQAPAPIQEEARQRARPRKTGIIGSDASPTLATSIVSPPLSHSFLERSLRTTELTFPFAPSIVEELVENPTPFGLSLRQLGDVVEPLLRRPAPACSLASLTALGNALEHARNGMRSGSVIVAERPAPLLIGELFILASLARALSQHVQSHFDSSAFSGEHPQKVHRARNHAVLELQMLEVVVVPRIVSEQSGIVVEPGTLPAHPPLQRSRLTDTRALEYAHRCLAALSTTLSSPGLGAGRVSA
ncbi:MAG: hypothetical protein KDD64_13550, partial [Bdellovibrionales bacterium]|nr:hypothetical protein [Bdellovibrionales bacterium]